MIPQHPFGRGCPKTSVALGNKESLLHGYHEALGQINWPMEDHRATSLFPSPSLWSQKSSELRWRVQSQLCQKLVGWPWERTLLHWTYFLICRLVLSSSDILTNKILECDLFSLVTIQGNSSLCQVHSFYSTLGWHSEKSPTWSHYPSFALG